MPKSTEPDVIFVKKAKPKEKAATDRYGFSNLKNKENRNYVKVGDTKPRTLRSKINLERIKWQARTGHTYSVIWHEECEEVGGEPAFEIKINELAN